MSDYRFILNKKNAVLQIQNILQSISEGEGLHIQNIRRQILINNGLDAKFVNETIENIIDDSMYIELDYIYRRVGNQKLPLFKTPEEEAEEAFKNLGLKQ